jgi:zinc and cadmium transporter
MMIKFLFSLAFGALLGDAMIHILPEAYTAEGTDSRVTAGIFIGAILFFLILERIFEACGITHQHWHGKDTHSHD